jgi:hypothetical protein
MTIEPENTVQIDFHVEPDEWLDIEQLTQMYHPFNSQVRNDAELTAIERSIREEGFTAEMIILNRVNQKIVSGHGRVQVCWNMGYRGKLPVIWKEYQTEEEHRRSMLRWNKARGHQDAELEKREIEALIEAYGQEQVQLDQGYTDEQIAELLATLTEGETYLGVEKDAQPNPRHLPIDAIFTWNSGAGECCVAVRSGLKFGVQSKKGRTYCPLAIRPRHKITFIDNDYFDYDHAVHVEYVSHYKPKYATTRDIMTKEQCQKAGIPYFELSQILDFAEELSQHAENVILIPKYDCLDKIPDKYMLGYSVPTSHGGTPLPVSAFKGWRVHLLGGSWKAQLAHMAELEDDVVSLDNNYVGLIANYGSFIYPDGRTGSVNEILGGMWAVSPREIAMAISFSAIGSKLNELYGDTATQEDWTDAELAAFAMEDFDS